MIINDTNLYKLLLDNGFIVESGLKSALQKSKVENKTFWECLLELDLISDENLGKVVADYLKVPFISLRNTSISQDTLKIIPEKIATDKKVIAFEESKDQIKLASSNKLTSDLVGNISKKSGRKVSIYFATDRDIDEALTLYKNSLGKVIEEMINEKDLPVVKIFESLIESAYDSKVSDVHIEPDANDCLVRFRIDGVLHDKIKISKSLYERILTRIKVESKLRTDEHLSAQDGKMQVALPKEDLDIRVSIVPVVDGENIVLRLLSSRSRQFGLTDLGMSDKDLDKVSKSLKKPYGMILSTGPTGSGKTTTIYSILKILNTRERNIDTIEDPVEYEIEGINQIQVNNQTNLTFAEGLRSILRQDPDIIYVGEIRDEETAGIAINSALTGHLVLSTLHTNNSATTLPRLFDMGVEPFLVASTVNVIIAQRLIRKICNKCKASLEVDITDLEKSFDASLIKKYFKEDQKITVYHGKGCSVCNGTGYFGRVGLFEVLVMSPSLKDLVVAKSDAATINKKAIEEGMTLMVEDGLQKVQSGVTTIEEVLRSTSSN